MADGSDQVQRTPDTDCASADPLVESRGCQVAGYSIVEGQAY